MITIFGHIYDQQPRYIKLETALDRIRTGKSKMKVEEIRATIDDNKLKTLKGQLPCILFSGKFAARYDSQIIEHSGYIVLDFDKLGDQLRNRQNEIISFPFVYACWVSPGGNGLKALVRIADGSKHRGHFAALKEIFPDADDSGKNESRICYESYDPDLYLSESAEPFVKVKTVEQVVIRTRTDGTDVFSRLLKWMANKNNAFQTGERNIFIFKLASACCRFGIGELEAQQSIFSEFSIGTSDFTQREAVAAVKSAYRTNRANQGTASFEKDVLVDNVSRTEVDIDATLYDITVKPKDVIFGADVKPAAININLRGFPSIKEIGIPTLDHHFKSKRGELTLVSGIGNYGKSTLKKWYQLMRAVKFGEKFATFAPEDNPAEEFYHEMVDILFGRDCSANNPFRPSVQRYEQGYDFISNHFFYVYPKDIAPTPEYIKERFLELIIKEKVDGVDIDPFNQMTNDYSKHAGRSDKYLETILSDFLRFYQQNNVYGWIVAHPKQMQKGQDKNFLCPDLFDIADGAMWNNKVDNMIIYHRPLAQSEPQNPMAEWHQKKARRKAVGKKGTFELEYVWSNRRFYIDNEDWLQKFISERTDLNFIFQDDLYPVKTVPATEDPTSHFIQQNFYDQETEAIDDFEGF